MWSEGNATKNEVLTFGLCFTTMLQHTGCFGKERLSKEQCDNSRVFLYSSDLAAAEFYLFPQLMLALFVSQK